MNREAVNARRGISKRYTCLHWPYTLQFLRCVISWLLPTHVHENGQNDVRVSSSIFTNPATVCCKAHVRNRMTHTYTKKPEILYVSLHDLLRYAIQCPVRHGEVFCCDTRTRKRPKWCTCLYRLAPALANAPDSASQQAAQLSLGAAPPAECLKARCLNTW